MIQIRMMRTRRSRGANSENVDIWPGDVFSSCSDRADREWMVQLHTRSLLQKLNIIVPITQIASTVYQEQSTEQMPFMDQTCRGQV